MQNEHRLMARWKDVLLYLDTYHLILHIRNANKKVDGGDSRVQSRGKKHTENFFFSHRALPWPRKLLPLTLVSVELGSSVRGIRWGLHRDPLGSASGSDTILDVL